MITFGLVFLALYGGIANYFDRTKRPDYWLDNKPLVYQIEFRSIPLAGYDSVYLADLFGRAAQYCRFYQEDCSKFVFENFQMTDLISKDNVAYIGFGGNFNGKKSDKNNEEREDFIYDGQKIKFIHTAAIRDNVADGYGQKIILGTKAFYEIK